MDVARIYDGCSALVIYGLESYGFCKEGAALDFIQDGRMELDGDLPLNAHVDRPRRANASHGPLQREVRRHAAVQSRYGGSH